MVLIVCSICVNILTLFLSFFLNLVPFTTEGFSLSQVQAGFLFFVFEARLLAFQSRPKKKEIVGRLTGDHLAGFLLNPPICSPESYSLSHTL